MRNEMRHTTLTIFLLMALLLLFVRCEKNPIDSRKIETDWMTDIDGNRYQTVKIGDQWWLADNLKVTRYANGAPIPYCSDPTEWSQLSTGAYCEYDNDSSYVNLYGRLYNWYALVDSQSVAPAGWHIPDSEEWQKLIDYLGGASVAAGKLKATGTDHWASPNTGATNQTGFTALPGGGRLYDGAYINITFDAIFWSSTEISDLNASCRSMVCSGTNSYTISRSKRSGFAVRLVKDTTPGQP